MRVTIPVMALELGGGTRSLVKIAEGLSQYGHDVRFLIPRDSPVQWDVKVPILRVTALKPGVFPPADVILPNFWPTVMPAWQSGRGKVVRLCQGYEPLWVTDPVARETYRLPARILAISRWVAEKIKEDTGQDAQVIPLGVDHEILHPPQRPAERTGILYIWRHKAHGYDFKGSDDFVAALGPVLARHPDLPVTVVTPEPLPVSIPCPCRVEVAPSDQELADLYRQTKLFVSTSWFEAFSLGPLEAMTCGAAVVSTDCGGIREYAVNGQNCLLVPPRTPDQLAEAILRVLEAPGLAGQLGEHGIATGREWPWVRTWDVVDHAIRMAVSNP